MNATLIATTPKVSMHALAFQGIMAYSCFPQIRDMLLRRFGDDYVLLFARPVENAGDGNIDWYSPVRGAARKLMDLPGEEREPIRAAMARMADDIGNFAEEMIQSRDPLKITRGNILKLALRYPDDNALYVIGEQPVATCWGFGPGTPGVEGASLMRPARPEPAPAEKKAAPLPPQTSPGPRRGWNWWWLLPLLVLLLLLLLLFSSFGQVPAMGGKALFSFPALPFMQETESRAGELAALESETRALRAEVEKRAALCLPEEPSPEKTPPAKKEELVIPDKARDATFMEGRWMCDTGLYNTRTGEAVKVTFFFGADGRGQGIIFEKNDKCEGKARAEMRGNTLRIELGEQVCARSGSSYSPMIINCDNAGAAGTRCEGVNKDNTRWEGNFYREK